MLVAGRIRLLLSHHLSPDAASTSGQPTRDMGDVVELRERWTELYSKTLPQLARSGDPAQAKWPVHLDHCFARIILDNTVGEGKQQWDKVIKRPAVKNMTHEQLEKAIELGKQIQNGNTDLVALDVQSLDARGKLGKKYKDGEAPTAKHLTSPPAKKSPTKRKAAETTEVPTKPQPEKKARTQHTPKQSMLSFPKPAQSSKDTPKSPEVDLSPTIQKLKAESSLTPYRKRLYAALLSVPRGRFTTYAALSTFLDSSARAVGNGMRNNPFAPDVPCHRVLASDGSIGGFGGSWGSEGKNASKKIALLREEGVTFDSRGRVKGLLFEGFVDLLARPERDRKV